MIEFHHYNVGSLISIEWSAIAVICDNLPDEETWITINSGNSYGVSESYETVLALIEEAKTGESTN